MAVSRPVATTMVFVALTVVGAFSFSRLSVDLFPELDFPSISVVTSYSGVGPEEMETLITRPIEAAIARVEGIEEISSFSSEGRSRVALRFDWGVQLESALNDVRASVERVRSRLPEDAAAPVVYKFDLTNIPIMYLAMTGDMDEARLRRFAEDVVAPYFERVAGVASVDIQGARNREIRIEVDAERLTALEIGLMEVVGALRNQSLTVPAGLVEDGTRNVSVRAMGEFESAEEIVQAVVAWRGGVPIRIADVATVVDGFEDYVNIVRINGEPAVRLTISKSPGANTVEVSDDLHRAVERFNADYGDEAHLRVVVDSATFIRRSISGVQSSVLVGAALALLALLFFLQSVRSTLIIGVAIPISVIATFLLMYQLGLTLNLITFGGLALGIGMLVDNSIVILENIYRKREAGTAAKEAAVDGSAEVGSAIVASTMTTLAVFLPVIFLGGFAAVFFGQMALVVTSALLCSLFVALTLVPVMASVLLRRSRPTLSKSRNPIGKGLRGLEAGYAWLVRQCLRFSPVVFIVAVAALAVSLTYSDQVGTELLPEADESQVSIRGVYPVGTRIEVTLEAVERIEQMVREHVPEATDVQARLGTSGFWSTSGEESASVRINLVPVEERDRSSEEVAEALRPLLISELPGMRAFARAGGELWIFRFIRGGDSRLRVEIRGHDLEVSDAIARRVIELITPIEGVADARASREQGGPEVLLYVDRDRASDYGLTTRNVAEMISVLVQGWDAGVFREGGDEFRIRVRLGEEALRSAEEVLSTPVTLPDGGAVQLRDLVQVVDGTTPKAIERINQERIVVVSGGIEESYDLGTVTEAVREALAELEVPEGFSVIIAGESAEQESTFSSMFLGVFLALLLVYMVMAGQFESFIQPIVIMAAVPFAFIGVIATLLLTDTTFNINSFMGVIVLVGVVVNNAIVFIDYINLMRRRYKYALREAIVESARRRLRPILMTTATTVLALLPVAIGGATGGESQSPLARVVIGGLISSTAITLILVPVLYFWTEALKAKLLGRKRAPESQVTEN